MHHRLVTLVMSFVLFTLVSAGFAFSQPAPAPFILRGYDGDLQISERSDVPVEETGERWADVSEGIRITREDVGNPSAPWVIIRFGPFNLGENSQLVISSLRDPEQVQTFTQEKLAAWGGESARFNGGEVRIELVTFPGDSRVFYEFAEFMFGTPIGESIEELNETIGQPEPESICGEDDRTSSFDHRIGRLMPVGCTGWTLDNGALLTAGHCVHSAMRILEFHVPQSLPDGTTQSPPVEHQFRVVQTSIAHKDRGVGQDWAVFSVLPADDGRLPHQIYGSFGITQQDESEEVTVLGYGTDDAPVGETGKWNSDNQTQQEHTGALDEQLVNSEQSAVVRHRAGTQKGNSGSPIFIAGPDGEAIGIHTHGGCARTSNEGTSFRNEELWGAIHR